MPVPVTGTSVAMAGLMPMSLPVPPGVDYGVVFGAFAGAVFYVATATDACRMRQAAYFLTSFIVGILGAGLVGAKLAALTHYSEHSLDSLGAVVVSAITIKVLTFLNGQDLNSLLGIVSRWRGGGSGK